MSSEISNTGWDAPFDPGRSYKKALLWARASLIGDVPQGVKDSLDSSFKRGKSVCFSIGSGLTKRAPTCLHVGASSVQIIEFGKNTQWDFLRDAKEFSLVSMVLDDDAVEDESVDAGAMPKHPQFADAKADFGDVQLGVDRENGLPVLRYSVKAKEFELGSQPVESLSGVCLAIGFRVGRARRTQYLPSPLGAQEGLPAWQGTLALADIEGDDIVSMQGDLTFSLQIRAGKEMEIPLSGIVCRRVDIA